VSRRSEGDFFSVARTTPLVAEMSVVGSLVGQGDGRGERCDQGRAEQRSGAEENAGRGIDGETEEQRIKASCGLPTEARGREADATPSHAV
jgi:hypothetical protein